MRYFHNKQLLSLSLFSKQRVFFQFSRVETSKDYYKLLGVNESSKPADIKSAFFKLAKKYHPDTNPTAGEKFKEINEAYQVLSDTIKKSDYDNARMRGQDSNNSNTAQRRSDNRKQQYDQTYEQYEYQQRTRQANDKFYYYWEGQNAKGGNPQQDYRQYQQQNYQYQRQKEEARRQDDGQMNDAMRDFLKGVQQEQQRRYQQNTAYSKQQQSYNNPYHQEELLRRQEEGWNRYENNIQRMHEEQMKERYREELRKQQEYEDWQRKKDEMLMKEVQEKVDSIKNNVKNVGKKVEEVASVAKDLGGKVMSFFKKK